MADFERVWERVDADTVLDFDDISGGVGISLGHPSPEDDSYPTLVLLGQSRPDGGRVIEVVGREEPPFSMAPRVFIPKTLRQTVAPATELVLGNGEGHNHLGLNLGRLASRTHLSLQVDPGAHQSRVTLRDLNSKHGTFLSMPGDADWPEWLQRASEGASTT